MGDATNLAAYADQSIDLVHSNSVIEHVGSWNRMAAMARETQRVGKAGWIQTPAWEFPIEPHFRLPFVHWMAAPARRRLLTLRKDFRSLTLGQRRAHVDDINMLSRREFTHLYEGCELTVEWLLLPKSYTAIWKPVAQLAPTDGLA